MREDYSPDGDAWDYFPPRPRRSRAYRWGEDGLAGSATTSSASASRWRSGTARDPILKERLFGLTNSEGNHGEDVKELYYYLDATPTHSYLKMLYKYPQRAFPYARLVEENRRRGKDEPEFELLDTGVFDDDRYFDVFVEYAKADARRHPDADHGRTTAARRRPTLHLLPQLWFRNTWSWDGRRASRPAAAALERRGGSWPRHPDARRSYALALRRRRRSCCSPRTKRTSARLFGATDADGYVKDALPRVRRRAATTAPSIPQRRGTKAAAHYALDDPAPAAQRRCACG